MIWSPRATLAFSFGSAIAIWAVLWAMVFVGYGWPVAVVSVGLWVMILTVLAHVR